MVGEVGRKGNLETDKWAKKDITINGLQMLWLIYHHYDLEGLGAVYDMEDLMSLSLSGGDRGLEACITSWDYNLASMTDEPQDNLLRYLFQKQVNEVQRTRDVRVQPCRQRRPRAFLPIFDGCM